MLPIVNSGINLNKYNTNEFERQPPLWSSLIFTKMLLKDNKIVQIHHTCVKTVEDGHNNLRCVIQELIVLTAVQYIRC